MQISRTPSSLNNFKKINQQDLAARKTQTVVLPVWHSPKTRVAINCIKFPSAKWKSWEKWSAHHVKTLAWTSDGGEGVAPVYQAIISLSNAAEKKAAIGFGSKGKATIGLQDEDGRAIYEGGCPPDGIPTLCTTLMSENKHRRIFNKAP